MVKPKNEDLDTFEESKALRRKICDALTLREAEMRPEGKYKRNIIALFDNLQRANQMSCDIDLLRREKAALQREINLLNQERCDKELEIFVKLLKEAGGSLPE